MNNGQADDQAKSHFLEEDHETSTSSEKLTDRSQQHSLWWRRIWNALLTPAYNPRFPPGPLQRPLVGYLAAILLQVIIGIGMILFVRTSPGLRFPAGLILLAVPLTALIWGTGPSILAAFSGTALLVYLRLSHYFSHVVLRSEDVIGIFLYLIIGLTISLLASQTQNTRYRAALETNRLHRFYEELIAQLLAERQARQASERKLDVREKQLEAIFEMTTEAVFILDALGAPPQLNQAAKDLLDLAPGTRTSSTLEHLFDLLDSRGNRLSPALWPGTRLLRGERLSTNDPSAVLIIRTHTGETHSVRITGIPIQDGNNIIVGAILICHAVA